MTPQNLIIIHRAVFEITSVLHIGRCTVKGPHLCRQSVHIPGHGMRRTSSQQIRRQQDSRACVQSHREIDRVSGNTSPDEGGRSGGGGVLNTFKCYQSPEIRILYEHIINTIYICNPQSQLFLFVRYLTTCFGPYGPSSGKKCININFCFL
jgi:hypothetical protein